MDDLSWAFLLHSPVPSNLLVSIFLIAMAWYLCKVSFLQPHSFLQTQTALRSPWDMSPNPRHVLHIFFTSLYKFLSSSFFLYFQSIKTYLPSVPQCISFFSFFSYLIYLMWRYLFSIRPQAGLDLRTNRSRHILQGDGL